MPNIVRKQLIAWGASVYLARRLTSSLVSTAKVGRANGYDSQEVVGACYKLLEKPRTRLATRNILEALIGKLQGTISPKEIQVDNSNDAEFDAILNRLDNVGKKVQKHLRDIRSMKIQYGTFDEHDRLDLENCFRKS